MRERGGISFGCLLTLVVLGVGGYLGWMFGLPYYYHSVVQEKLYESAEMAFHQEREEAVKAIVKVAAENHVSLVDKNISLVQTQSNLTIDADYQVPVETFIISRTLKFHIHVTRNFSR